MNKIREEVSGSILHEEALSLIDQIYELELIHDIEQTYEQCWNDIQNIQQRNLSLLSQISPPRTKDDYVKLKQDFRRLENLGEELQGLKTQYIKIQEDLVKFNDLESLKRQADRRKQQLIADKLHLPKRKETTHVELQTLQSQFDILQRQLQTNQTHQEFLSLEQKLQTLLSPDDHEYEQIKHQALNLVSIHNQWLIERLKPLS